MVKKIKTERMYAGAQLTVFYPDGHKDKLKQKFESREAARSFAEKRYSGYKVHVENLYADATSVYQGKEGNRDRS
jgi:hypothetical protein